MNKTFMTVAALAMLQACGGGAERSVLTPSQAAAKQGEAVVQYSPAPARTLEIRPSGSSPIVKVEFLLFGYDKVEMALPNGVGPEHQGSYVFSIPQSFTSESYVCGSGRYVSEVRITNAAGTQAAQLFEICPDRQLTTQVPSI